MSLNKKGSLTDSEHALFLLREIESNPNTTQRDLSRKLSISLGKINFLIKALLNKGVIEAKNFKNSKNKRGYMYLLTAHGIKIKIQLTKSFLEWKTAEYDRIKKEIEYFQREISGGA